jgi:hypothetical protein
MQTKLVWQIGEFFKADFKQDVIAYRHIARPAVTLGSIVFI